MESFHPVAVSLFVNERTGELQIRVDLHMNKQKSWHIHVPTLFFVFFLNAYSEWMERFHQYHLDVVQKYVTPTFHFF